MVINDDFGRIYEANTASKQPRRSNLKSHLKFVAQTTYATMFVWTVLVFFEQMAERGKKEEHLRQLDLLSSPLVKSHMCRGGA